MTYRQMLVSILVPLGLLMLAAGAEEAKPRAVAPPATQPAKKITVGQYTFEVPEGWEQREEKKTTMLVPPGSKQENAPAAIVIYPAMLTKKVEIEKWFNQFTTKVHKDFTVKKKSDLKAAEGDGSGTFLMQFFVLELKGAPQYRLYAVANAGDTAQVMMFSCFSQEDFKKYLPAMTKFIATAQAVDAEAAPQKAK